MIEVFKERFNYINGILVWSDSKKNKNKGKEAGRVKPSGYKSYRQVKICGKHFYTHRVIWIMHYGEIPEGLEVDHINGDGLDNNIKNLRIVDRLTNNRNKRRTIRGSSSGITGVTWDKHAKMWKAHIQVLGKHINLGLFEDKFCAASARKYADEKYGFDSSHGSMLL